MRVISFSFLIIAVLLLTACLESDKEAVPMLEGKMVRKAGPAQDKVGETRFTVTVYDVEQDFKTTAEFYDADLKAKGFKHQDWGKGGHLWRGEYTEVMLLPDGVSKTIGELRVGKVLDEKTLPKEPFPLTKGK